jgi:hypothetical protein
MRLKIITILVFLFLMIPSISISAEEKRNIYPNVLTYNSTSSCIQGVVSLLLVSNPNLRNQLLPPAVLQQLISHCSCIMDKIRLLHPVEEYYANMHDYVWIRDLWGRHGAECVDMGYLAGLGIGRKPLPSDNQTTEEPEPKILEPEETLGEDTSFQG